MDTLAVFPPQLPGPLQLLQEPALGIRDVPGRAGGTDSSTAWRRPHGRAAPLRSLRRQQDAIGAGHPT